MIHLGTANSNGADIYSDPVEFGYVGVIPASPAFHKVIIRASLLGLAASQSRNITIKLTSSGIVLAHFTTLIVTPADAEMYYLAFGPFILSQGSSINLRVESDHSGDTAVDLAFGVYSDDVEYALSVGPVIDSTGGGLTLGAAVSQIRSMLVGKAVYDPATGVASYYDNAGNAVVISTPLLGSGSRNAPTVS